MKHILLACLLASPTQLLAEVDHFAVGQFLKLTARYDHKQDRFIADVFEGERDACFRVESIGRDGVVMSLVKGDLRPWWNEKIVYKPGGYTDTWSTSDGYRENHPEATRLDGLYKLFTAHPACP